MKGAGLRSAILENVDIFLQILLITGAFFLKFCLEICTSRSKHVKIRESAMAQKKTKNPADSV